MIHDVNPLITGHELILIHVYGQNSQGSQAVGHPLIIASTHNTITIKCNTRGKQTNIQSPYTRIIFVLFKAHPHGVSTYLPRRIKLLEARYERSRIYCRCAHNCSCNRNLLLIHQLYFSMYAFPASINEDE